MSRGKPVTLKKRRLTGREIQARHLIAEDRDADDNRCSRETMAPRRRGCLPRHVVRGDEMRARFEAAVIRHGLDSPIGISPTEIRKEREIDGFGA